MHECYRKISDTETWTNFCSQNRTLAGEEMDDLMFHVFASDFEPMDSTTGLVFCERQYWLERFVGKFLARIKQLSCISTRMVFSANLSYSSAQLRSHLIHTGVADVCALSPGVCVVATSGRFAVLLHIVMTHS